MFEFVRLHGIVPWVETGRFDLQGITEGVERLRRGETRYKYVIPGDRAEFRFVAVAEDV